MKGTIEFYSEDGFGAIIAEDGRRFAFQEGDLAEPDVDNTEEEEQRPPQPGDQVEFTADPSTQHPSADSVRILRE